MEIEKLAGSKVKFKVVIPVDTFKKALDDAFEKKNQEVEIKGFRKGQAPRKVYEAVYGVESLYNDAINYAISETYYEAVSENKIDVCGYPKIDLDESTISQTSPIEYTVTVSVNPTVELGEYKNLEIKKDKVSVIAKEVEEEIKKTLDRNAMLVKKEGEDAVIALGDTAVFDFEGFKDGVAFDGGSAKDYSLEIGSHSFIPGFEEQMVGMKAGEEKDLNVKFPDDYQAENLKGADAVFHVNVKEIKYKDTPSLDEDFIKEQKIEGVTTPEEYKKHVKKTILDRKESQALEKAKNDLYMTVVKNAKFELPEDLVEEEANYSLDKAEQQAKQYGMNLETLLKYTGGQTVEEYKATLKTQATNTLSLRFVLKEIAKAEGFTATEEELEAKYKEIADQYRLSVDQVKDQVNKSAVEEEIVTERAYKLIEDTAKFVTEESKPKTKKSE
ncbi:trigger factor [bacterium]|nr:trigger factor [bacterium]